MTRCCLGLCSAVMVWAQTVRPEDPVRAIVNAFDKHQIVMLGEIHESRQQHEFLRKLVASPAFASKVNDVVMEFGNALYQDVIDRYIAGESVALEEAQKAWRNTLALGAVSPVYGEFYAAVRAVNQMLPREKRLRVLLGDPPVEWEKVTTREDLAPYVPVRDQHYAGVVSKRVLDKKRKALLIMGSGHFRRNAGKPGLIEQEIRKTGAEPFVILPGSHIVGGYDDLEPRFEEWRWPWLVRLKGTWIGALAAQPVLMGGLRGNASFPGTLEEAADAFLFVGPRDRLTRLRPRRSELIGTSYGKEIERRLRIIFGKAPEFIPKSDEQPQFERNPPPPPPLPPPPKK